MTTTPGAAAVSLDVYEDIERCMSGGWSDGLPVIPPYGSLVDQMLAAMAWDFTEVVGSLPEQSIEVHAAHVAAAAVMAGCKFEYGPVLRALTLALLDPAFNITGVEVTTGGASATVIVSGPAVERYGFAHEANCMGANNRANATVGRFAQLVRYFCGRGGGALQSHGTMGHPGRLSFCIAEHPETVWAPFHTQFGLAASASAVTVVSTEGPQSVNNHYAETGEAVLETIAGTLANEGTTNFYWYTGGYLIVIGPEHMEMIAKSYSRAEARQFLYTRAVKPTDELLRIGRLPKAPRRGSKVVPGTDRPPVASPEQLHFIESGGAGGKFSAVIPRWVGSRAYVCRPIEDQPAPTTDQP
jgi:hypothetical protein